MEKLELAQKIVNACGLLNPHFDSDSENPIADTVKAISTLDGALEVLNYISGLVLESVNI